MKKAMLGLMLILGLGATQANAQSVSFGVKAEANLSNFILSDMSGVESKMGVGATVGGFAKFDITQNFAIQPELLFHFQASKTEAGSIKRPYEYWGMEIPVYAMGQWTNRSNGRFYAGVGPYIGVGFDAKYFKPETKLYKNDVLQPWDFGFGAQVGYEFANGIQINGGYKIGVIDALDTGKDDATMLPQRISLGVGFRF
ncbi:PorT family protein [Alistipes sp. OttesenSCG-928-B03]|nr:PorT family protein [Alistipes sp. OttesenSCG-928-B03]